jgi:epidermal growth factor receptor substrate 15
LFYLYQNPNMLNTVPIFLALQSLHRSCFVVSAEESPLTSLSTSDSADDIFGTPLSQTPTSTAPAQPQATASAKTPFDDDDDLDDDDFEGLEDAKEGSADDDFANISRSGLDDFNSVFDSPQPSQVKSDSAFDFGTLSTSSLPANPGSATSPGPTSGGADGAKADAGDWDAMFSGLDSIGAGEPPAKTETEERPEAKRADTAEDDPMLKQLVGMGYPRGDALSALEKFDYDLERVS